MCVAFPCRTAFADGFLGDAKELQLHVARKSFEACRYDHLQPPIGVPQQILARTRATPTIEALFQCR